jgi:hypothetical protein
MSKTKTKGLRYLGNVLKVPAHKIPDILSGKIHRIILPEGSDYHFKKLYAYQNDKPLEDALIGVFDVVTRYPFYIASSKVVFVDNINIYGGRKQDFLNSVGFDDFDSMIEFFSEKYGLPFSGRIIEWKV